MSVKSILIIKLESVRCPVWEGNCLLWGRAECHSSVRQLMGEGGGCTADVADSAGFCRRAAGPMSSVALWTTAGPADSNHSACCGRETRRLAVGRSLWWSRTKHWMHTVAWPRRPTGKWPAAPRHTCRGRARLVARRSARRNWWRHGHGGRRQAICHGRQYLPVSHWQAWYQCIMRRCRCRPKILEISRPRSLIKTMWIVGKRWQIDPYLLWGTNMNPPPTSPKPPLLLTSDDLEGSWSRSLIKTMWIVGKRWQIDP